MSGSFSRYAAAAFNFRPYGMFVAPNWIGVAAFGLLGALNPGIWLIGAGLELAYLLSMVSNPRFRALVDRRSGARDDAAIEQRLAARVARLEKASQRRHHALRERCEAVLEAQRPDDHTDTVQHRAEALGTLVTVHLDLLERAEVLARLQAEADRELGPRLASVQQRLADPGLGEELRRSLEGQAEVLRERFDAQRAAAEKSEYVGSELARVEHQVELLREQTLLDAEPGAMARRIDALTDTLRHTREWLRDQRRLEGLTEEPEAEAPILRARRARASQGAR